MSSRTRQRSSAWSGAKLTVEDLGSRNGTRVNGEVISEPTAVDTGDHVYLHRENPEGTFNIWNPEVDCGK